jgi:hypothetical protein
MYQEETKVTHKIWKIAFPTSFEGFVGTNMGQGLSSKYHSSQNYDFSY